MDSVTNRTWSIQNIQDLVQDKLEKRSCYFKIKVAQALYAGKDVVACAPTGAGNSGKTLTFDTKDSMVRLLESKASRINLTAGCKLDISVDLHSQLFLSSQSL
jgi:hypothetical protein